MDSSSKDMKSHNITFNFITSLPVQAYKCYMNLVNPELRMILRRKKMQVLQYLSHSIGNWFRPQIKKVVSYMKNSNECVL